MTLLGIESSCDETAIAVVRRHEDGRAEIMSNVVLSQTEAHAPYGGVVPEIAARAHILHADGLLGQALARAGLNWGELDGVAATAGPGLIGGVMVGLMTGKAVALAHDLPFIGVNHLEGHALSVRLTEEVAFPYLLLLASGGHSQLLAVEGVGRYRRLGTTLDDALGEAFDKAAKMLGLGMPGGPAVEAMARKGDAARFALPRPLLGSPSADFSFSGLKTALRRTAEQAAPLSEADCADLCASFQAAAGDCVEDRTARAMALFTARLPDGSGRRLVMAGGVAANAALRAQLEALCADQEFALHVPPMELCTDNGAMIAWAGAERLALGQRDALDMGARARWPLDELTVPPGETP
ncbi:MAG TPA: tRNA (adenosine(37)-N6)-threonylcarbamoyltransferase complex transferase subunit TsaD [Rhodobacteraceae bacterium]|nr:tRNA (adenosine(37)-N6)-threonylcarbamoyltransferase complex transferase subunit TsaD [Paracoccaceae bacterium]